MRKRARLKPAEEPAIKQTSRYTEAAIANIPESPVEGMVAKRIASVYVSGRTKDWLKIKTAAGKDVMQKRLETWNG